MRNVLARVARLRVPLGFAFAVIVFLCARPTPASLLYGGLVAALGEAIRVWAAGHLEKGREVTSSGPYRWTGHPLYAGSTVVGIGLILVSKSWVDAVIVAVYLAVTLTAAIRTEEAFLREKFGAEYDAYRAGHSVRREFSVVRAIRNREHRAILGLAVGLALLALRMAL